MLAFFERISAVMIHISLYVLIFVSVRQKGKLWLYPLAVFLHFAVDCTVILPHVLGTPLWLFEIVFFLASLAVAVCVAVYYQKLPQVFEAPEAEIPAAPARSGSPAAASAIFPGQPVACDRRLTIPPS